MSVKSLGSKTFDGIKWTTLATLLTSIMQIGYTAIMARLLSPADFGLVAMSGVVLRFGTYFANMGMSQAIIQKKDLTNENIRAAFTSSFVLGTLFYVVFWFIAEPATAFLFDNPRLVPIIRIMAVSFVLSGMASTSTSLMRKKLEFKSLSKIEVLTYIISYCGVGLILAYFGAGVYSLIIASLTQVILSGVIAYSIVRHNVMFLFSWQHYKPMFAFGSKISFISFLEFLRGNLDTMVVGRMFGASLLGIYNRAFELISLPTYYLTNSFSKVLFPAFSILQAEMARLRGVYFSFTALLAYIMFPACIGVAVAAEQIVLLMLGDQWLSAVPILQILALGMPFRVLSNINGITCDATAHLKPKVYLQVLYLTVLTTLYYLLRFMGVSGIAVAFVVTEILLLAAYIVVTKNFLEYRLLDVAKAYIPGILSGLVTGGLIFTVTFALKDLSLPNIALLGSQITTGAFAVLLLLFWRPNRRVKGEIYKRLSSIAPTDNYSYKNRVFTRVIKILAV
jgi:lipopolysaccharide exporter